MDQATVGINRSYVVNPAVELRVSTQNMVSNEDMVVIQVLHSLYVFTNRSGIGRYLGLGGKLPQPAWESS